MILEKIKEHAGKISFFAINILLIVIGAMFIKQKTLQDSLESSLIPETASLAASDEIASSAQALQENIAIDRQQKIDSIANNPASITQQQNVAVTKTVPGASRTVSVPVASTSSKTSTKASTPAPAKSTKTS